jgi:hypothetical protein
MMGSKLVIYTSTRKYSHPFWEKDRACGKAIAR